MTRIRQSREHRQTERSERHPLPAGRPSRQTKGPQRQTISRAAEQAGVHVETIRYYERVGLIARPKAGGGYREYPEKTVERIRFIKRAQEFGFSLKEIGGLVGMAAADASCEDLCRQMEQKVAELNAEIERLTALRDQLTSLVGASPRTQSAGSSGNCAAMAQMAGLGGCGDDGCEPSERGVEP